jgi:hypothetical protein
MSDLTLVCSGPLVSATAPQATRGSPEGYSPLVVQHRRTITTPAGATRPLVVQHRRRHYYAPGCYPPSGGGSKVLPALYHKKIL